MMNDEPIDIALGLPGPLPAGERVLWHGKPERAALRGQRAGADVREHDLLACNIT